LTTSPDVLSGHATELRQLAGQLRKLAAQAEHVLDGVLAFDDPTTWQGPFATRACTTLGRWRSGLTATANEMHVTAAAWDRSAAGLDRAAADARKAQQVAADKAAAAKTAAAKAAAAKAKAPTR